MTKNRRRKQDARRQKAARAVSYTQALRETQSGTDVREIRGIPTPLPSLTNYTGGWKPGQLITVGGSIGVGKLTFAVDALVAALRDGKSVFLVSLEMHTDELRLKMLSAMSSVPLDFVSGGGRTVAERDAFVRAERELEAFGPRFTVAAWETQTLETIRNESRRLAGELSGLDLILIDNLDLIKISTDGSRRWRALAATSRGLKELALELNLSVMVLAQVFANHGGTGIAPRLSNFRGSGAIALDSDLVIFLHGDQKDSGAPQPLQVILAKHRAGEFGQVIGCEVDFSRVLIREVDPDASKLSAKSPGYAVANPILVGWALPMLGGTVSYEEFAARGPLVPGSAETQGATEAQQEEAAAELERFKLRWSKLAQTPPGERIFTHRMVVAWREGTTHPEDAPFEPTVWELGEDGENWFIEGTTDPELAMKSLLGWIMDTDPSALDSYDEAEDELRQTFSTRDDWFWLPLIAEDPEGELELCHLQKDRDRWTGQPLVRGIHAG